MKLEETNSRIVISFDRSHSAPVEDLERAIRYAGKFVNDGYKLMSAHENDGRHTWTFMK